MNKPIRLGLILVVGWFLVFYILPVFREEFPTLGNHVRVMKEEFSALDKVKYKFVHDTFVVDLYVSDRTEDEALKKSFQKFLSSEDFLAEFTTSAKRQLEEEDSSGMMPSCPEIWIYCYSSGEKESRWASYAMYYTQPYRSDRIMEVDGYQTWYDHIV